MTTERTPPVAVLADARERRTRTAAHPTLRWVAGDAFYVAHRKHRGSAACGAVGPLVLAPPGVPECVECFPLADR